MKKEQITEALFTSICKDLYESTGTMKFSDPGVLWNIHGKLWVKNKIDAIYLPSRHKSEKVLDNIVKVVKELLIQPLSMYGSANQRNPEYLPLYIKAAESFTPYWFEEDLDSKKIELQNETMYILFINDFRSILSDRLLMVASNTIVTRSHFKTNSSTVSTVVKSMDPDMPPAHL